MYPLGLKNTVGQQFPGDCQNPKRKYFWNSPQKNKRKETKQMINYKYG